ncbi:hypothetical protein [Xanthomonas arboricola]|uniref:hypothetical protein n=1 Tax=Xanthomonas arboricola TaxID=56448 RepID=UPI000CEF0493|nr:hypothetical protein [Xanthomonas arboricola]PPU40431.1 hypothetical protein XaplCFBP3123_11240 [Xanthomonas arboricola pv. populi]RYE77706.1 MAG: hypothetical protein EOO80_10195 [Oxalobacteraceae bacterium]
MKTTLVVSLLLGCVVVSGLAQAAQYMDANALSAAATGERFKSGADSFRMLPGAVVAESLPPDDADQSAPTSSKARANAAPSVASGKVAARIGPYAVVLDSTAGVARSAGVSGAERTLAAAVNERTGRAVLVRPQLKLTGTTPTTASSLARSSGGTIAYASTVDGSAVITYPSIEQAQRAATQLQGSNGIAQASLVVMQALMQPM